MDAVIIFYGRDENWGKAGITIGFPPKKIICNFLIDSIPYRLRFSRAYLSLTFLTYPLEFDTLTLDTCHFDVTHVTQFWKSMISVNLDVRGSRCELG